MEIQGKLLRVLEGSPFHRVGGQEPLRSDFRLIAATNRDVKAEVAAGRFRQDLYFRLAVYPIHLPPLRERPEDIFILAAHFLEQKARKIGRPPLNLSGAALLALNQHVWPGNVRELENLIERAVIVSTGDDVLPGDLFPEQAAEMGGGGGLRLEDMERMLIQLALQRSGHNKSQAAEMLGISRKTLGEKLNRLNIS
jgi:transcriptional regulator with PAS, ATPase and Fis domain